MSRRLRYENAQLVVANYELERQQQWQQQWQQQQGASSRRRTDVLHSPQEDGVYHHRDAHHGAPPEFYENEGEFASSNNEGYFIAHPESRWNGEGQFQPGMPQQEQYHHQGFIPQGLEQTQGYNNNADSLPIVNDASRPMLRQKNNQRGQAQGHSVGASNNFYQDQVDNNGWNGVY
mmetsp:Transcript_2089/g.4432  ORF Transcript_2089/g.4432 Transcript_2089/m.4432 type:complete len:176 (-) Transcript_2089:2671-3198(-)